MSTRERYKIAKSIEKKYDTLIQKLLEPIEKEALRYTDDITKFKQVLKNATNSPTYKRKVQQAIREIATMIYDENERDWRNGAFKSARGKEIRQAMEREIGTTLKKRMEELIKYNTALIVTLPRNISAGVVRHINSQALKGIRASEMESEIKKFFPQHSRASAQLIARTETSKFSSALTQARAEDLGIEWYEWNTSEDASVRSSHRLMDKVLVNYKHAPVPEKLNKKLRLKKYPAPYHAGNIYNCRCFQSPLTQLSDVRFPKKVYNWKKNKIETMTLAQFKRFSGIER